VLGCCTIFDGEGQLSFSAVANPTVSGILARHQEKVKPSPTCQLGQGGIRSGEMWRKSQLNERSFRNILSSTSFDASKGRNHVCISSFIFGWCRFNHHGITDHRFNCLRW
jgi:hypothetical protein